MIKQYFIIRAQIPGVAQLSIEFISCLLPEMTLS